MTHHDSQMSVGVRRGTRRREERGREGGCRTGHDSTSLDNAEEEEDQEEEGRRSGGLGIPQIDLTGHTEEVEDEEEMRIKMMWM